MKALSVVRMFNPEQNNSCGYPVIKWFCLDLSLDLDPFGVYDRVVKEF